MSDAPRRLGRWINLPILLSFAVFGTLPYWVEAIGLYQYLGLEIMVWVIFALGYNLLLGYAGLPSFGHGAFIGIGAYAFGVTQFDLVANLWVCLIAAVVITGLCGLVAALLVSRRRGIYFALMTIAIGQVFFFIASKWTSVTGGEDGLLNIERLPVDLGFISIDIHDTASLYYLAFAAYAVVVVLLWRLVHSPFGRILGAIRQNEERVRFLGYNVFLYKAIAFVLSAAVAGLAGGLFAMAQEGAYIQIMSLQWSGTVVLMTLIGGGLVSFWGPVFGVILYFIARDILGAYTEGWLLWFGLMFMLLVMFKPEGLAGIWRDTTRSLHPRQGARGARAAVPNQTPAE
ncbi:branched-chain amino acid ABC transporter permease [Acuticoccus kandeliae]|uniref:branched-chain amino acid ABC transporter permease n=1 Tax=Acuticoccus kandeliae TaxID=2073160 RepID=UPI000D3E2280|nr:branched-chain amino acid ABC transporter permease [Acuticoccus kandeliae]